MEQELAMQLAITTPLQALKGYSAPETGQAYTRARELALRADAGTSYPQMHTLGMLSTYHMVRAEHGMVLELSDRALEICRRLGDPAWAAANLVAGGISLFATGAFARALGQTQEMVALYDMEQHRSMAFIVGQDIGVSAHTWASWACWFLGYPDRALRHSEEALSLARAVEHPFSLCVAHDMAGFRLHLLRGEIAQARWHLERAASLAEEGRFPMFQAYAKIYSGWMQAEQGQAGAGIAQMREGLVDLEETGTKLFNALTLSLLADACARAGKVAEGLRLNDQALAWVERTGERFYEAELHRLRGDLLVQEGGADEAEVEACYQQALEVARGQQARSLELRAAMALARLWQGQGRATEARELLAPIYDWFSEGFDTPDLQAAKALLEELG
jgi:predicted ATPase